MSELYRHYDYVKDEPVMIISKMGSKRAFAIALNAAWKYRVERKQPVYGEGGEVLVYDDQVIPSDEVTKMQVFTMAKACRTICDMFGLLVCPQKYAEIASFIEDGIEDLLMMPPKETQHKIVGEGKTEIAGVRYHFPVFEGDFQ